MGCCSGNAGEGELTGKQQTMNKNVTKWDAERKYNTVNKKDFEQELNPVKKADPVEEVYNFDKNKMDRNQKH